MKKKLIFTLIFFLISIPTYSKEKIVYLDVEKIMQESIAGKAIISQIKKKRRRDFWKREKTYISKKCTQWRRI